MSDVYVITGHYLDRSGFYLFGVYESWRAVEDSVHLANAGSFKPQVPFKMPMDRFVDIDVFSDKS